MTFAFDTVDYARQLRKANIPYEQADALADALRMSLRHPGDLVTKADLRREIAALENRLIVKLGIFVTVAIAAFVLAILEVSHRIMAVIGSAPLTQGL
jgi:hypothetical protein